MMEAEERGWYALDTHVCADCVADEHLKSLINGSCDATICDYCGREADDDIAAPTEVIQEAIGSAVNYYFNDPTSAGVPWEEGAPVIDTVGTAEVLMSVALDCEDDLFSDIEGAFVNSEWVPTAGGNWVSAHPNEELSYSWERFVEAVKHESRYFFNSIPSEGHDEYSPAHILEKIAKVVEELGLVSTLPVNMRLFRVRERQSHDTWAVDAKEMGPPPNEKARAGRMNPAGISYFYLAQELDTAFAEVLSGPPCEAAHAEFAVVQELKVLDLCQIPPLPSIFDEGLREVREGLLFIDKFVKSISMPVKKDGSEHVEYVPSQVVSEYFAKVFRDVLGDRIHGIVFPSAVKPGGRNVVLFPTTDADHGFDGLVQFRSGDTVTYATWADFISTLQGGA